MRGLAPRARPCAATIWAHWIVVVVTTAVELEPHWEGTLTTELGQYEELPLA